MNDPLSRADVIASEFDLVEQMGHGPAVFSRFLSLITCDAEADPDAVTATARMLYAAADCLVGNDTGLLEALVCCGPVSRAIMAMQAFDLAQNHTDHRDVIAALAALTRIGDEHTFEADPVLLPARRSAEPVGIPTSELDSGYLRTLRICATQLLLPRPEGTGRITALTHLVCAAPPGDDFAQLDVLEAVVRLAAMCFRLAAEEPADVVAPMLRDEADLWSLKNLEF